MKHCRDYSPLPTTDKPKMVWRINASSTPYESSATLNRKTTSICHKNLDSHSLALGCRRVLVKVTYQPPTHNKTAIQSSSVFLRSFLWRFAIIHMQGSQWERVSNSSQKTEWPMTDIMWCNVHNINSAYTSITHDIALSLQLIFFNVSL